MNQKEKELFLALCSFMEPDQIKIERLIDKGAATPELLGYLFANRMAGVAYGVLEKTSLLAKTDREFRNSLYGAWKLNEKINADYIGCLNYLSVQLNACGVPYALLKGAYLCGKYPVGFRTSNDIDVLISPDDVGKVSATLKLAGFKQGYLKNGTFVAATRQQIIESKMTRGETVPFIKELKLPFIPYLEVDLNFSLDYKNGDESTIRAMLERTQNVNVRNAKIRTLSNCDFLLHLCSHLYKEATTVPWIRMKRDMTFYKFCDIYMILHELTEEQIANLIAEAEDKYLMDELAYCIHAVMQFFALNNEILKQWKDTYVSREDTDFTYVIAPTEKKTYSYIEKDIVKRFFAKDRMKLLSEVSK